MQYRVIKSFIAFAKTPEVGEIVELTTDQADALREVEAVVPYEVKVERPVKETKTAKKSARSSRQGRQSQPKTRTTRTKKAK